jgi:hypothetical protein
MLRAPTSAHLVYPTLDRNPHADTGLSAVNLAYVKEEIIIL